MKNNFWCYIVIILMSVYVIRAQNETFLSYDIFINNVIKNNPISKKASNYNEYGRLQNQAAKGNYDPIINSSFQSKQFNSKNYYTLFDGSIKQPIFTSQYLKAGYEFGNGIFINPEEATSSYGLPYIGFEVSLLQGLLFDKRRAEVLKSNHYKDYYNAEQKIIINNLLFQCSQVYFEWLFSKKQYDLQSYFMLVADKRLKGVEALADAGERPTIDTIEAAILFQARLLDMQSATIEIMKKNNELLSFNWINNQTAIDKNELLKTTDDLDAYYTKAKQRMVFFMLNDTLNNPIINQYKAKQQLFTVEARLRKELIKPKLDVSYNFLSNNTTAYAPILSPNNYKWGANLSFPLLLRNSKNEYKMAKLNADNNALELLFKQNELTLKQTTLKQNINILIQQLQNAERSVSYSKILVEAEQLKFENGESSIFMLNTRESKLLESELKLADYKLKFIKSVLMMSFINGSLDYTL